LKDRNISLETENKSLKDRNISLETENKSLQEKNNQINSSNKILTQKNSELEKNIEDLIEQNKKIEKNSKDKSELIDQRDQIIQKLKTQIIKLKEDKEEQEKINMLQNQEVAVMKSKVNELELSNSELLKQIDEIKTEQEQSYFRMLSETLENEIETLKKRNKQLSTLYKESTDEQKRYEMKIEELIGYNERMKEELNRLKSKSNL
ncbi:hypothetical protein JXR93_08725, partial [bacterium]|nr:hypothetical protein [bacterium]